MGGGEGFNVVILMGIIINYLVNIYSVYILMWNWGWGVIISYLFIWLYMYIVIVYVEIFKKL